MFFFLQMLLLLFVSFLSSYCCCDNDESLPPRLNGGDYNKDPLRPLIENIGGMIMMAIPLGSSEKTKMKHKSKNICVSCDAK